MADSPTVLLAGRMSVPWAEWLQERLTTDWNILSWHEDEDFEQFTERAPQADAIVGGRIRGDWPIVPDLKLYQIPFTGFDWLYPEDVPRGCTVCNAFEHEIAIAEYVMAALLDWEIGLSESHRRFRTLWLGGANTRHRAEPRRGLWQDTWHRRLRPYRA